MNSSPAKVVHPSKVPCAWAFCTRVRAAVPRGVLALAALAGCHPSPSSSRPAPHDAAAAPARPPTPSPDASVADVPQAPALGVFPGPLPALAAVVLATTSGASVPFAPASNASARRPVPDGTRVTFREELTGVGQGDSSSEVALAGEAGTLPNANVITEARLHRSPDGRWAVFHAIESCGDFCHGQVVLLGASGERLRACGDEPCVGPEVVVAWRPDHAEVAVGGWGLRVYALPSMQPRVVTDDFTSPAYAPDGTLYARHTGANDAVYALPLTGLPRRVFGAPSRAPMSTSELPVSDPAPVTFDASGSVLCASFSRGERLRTLRARPDGHPAPGTTACP